MTPAEEMARKARQERQAELAELTQKWQRLLDEEKSACLHCVELEKRNPERTEEKLIAVRYWWKTIDSVLWMFIRTRAQFNHELQPFPANALAVLAKLSEDLSNGVMPKIIADAGARRGRPLSRGERHHIAYGVLYFEAVKRGEISDRSPNKTVRQAYNVTAKAVQGWVNRREEICVGVPHKSLSPEKLKAKMLECGAVYSRSGRGAPSDN